MTAMYNTIIEPTNYYDFLSSHNASRKGEKTSDSTHTRIPNKDLNIFGGSYVITEDNLKKFHEYYHDNVFVKNKMEYLTEKQLIANGPMVVDFDFRYNSDIVSRQHTTEHIEDMISSYLDELKKYYIFEANKPFDIFIFEKPNVNIIIDKSLTKDGIHMLIGCQIDHKIQIIIREKMISNLAEMWDLPLTNDWASVLDEGITKGVTNWQLYGSRKPGNEAYKITQHFIVSFDESDNEFMIVSEDIKNFNLKKDFIKLSVQNNNNPKFELRPEINDLLKNTTIKKTYQKKRVINTDENEIDAISRITDHKQLKAAVECMLSNLKTDEYEINEIHEYTQILPEKYYGPGSHLLNRQVAFALKNTDERLFLSWIMLRSKASDFDYATITYLYNDWTKYFNTGKEGITRRSIMFWAKQDAFDEYQKVKATTVEYYIEESISSQTEFDIARVLYQMYKDKYVCVSYDKKGVWYIFKNHRWEIDKGLTLRLSVSTEIFNLYQKKQDDTLEQLNQESANNDSNEQKIDFIKKKAKDIGMLSLRLKKTNDKNNIMREAMELFYDKDFIRSMDTNKYLMCFKNGVVDFKNKIFRDGYPQDYITKTTGINYMIYDTNNLDIKKISDEIKDFMDKLFPNTKLNKYMWDHLSSCLIGTNKNQTFNIYHGNGSNGKSILADLMSATLGDYKGTVPITLVTEKRNQIGGTSSEVMQLKGVRYAVMQEPSKGVKLNEGVMKELTGGDPIQGRSLYSESETFEPQFKLVVCTNSLFDIESNDGGTWRRIRKVDFISKFIDEGQEVSEKSQYVFTKDKSLKEKLPLFAPVFACMLVKRAFETDGNVEDCDVVMEASNKYRMGQDFLSAFVNEKIVKTGNIRDKIKKRGLLEEFKLWFSQEQGGRKMPKGQELCDFMDKQFGLHTTSGWSNITYVQPEISEEVDINEL